ncbi:MAG: metal-dependent hydrolase [Candidatus Dadabacteria bacterium]|nr:MAG: metal-dependent hydrolase [Candidatus Dadabacteria bacterium]
MNDIKLTWLGHATTLIEGPNGETLLIDPWLSGNPSCPEAWHNIDRFAGLDVLLLSHGHFDHTGDAVDIARAHKPTVVAIFELCHWMEQQGVDTVSGMNKGGTQHVAGVDITLTTAHHSSAVIDADGNLIYTGDPCGFVLRFGNGRTIYLAGDTALFGDMALIRELYQPDVAVLPIGDHFTMGPREAAKAVELIGAKTILPVHYGTFPLLTGTPEALRKLIPGNVTVLEPQPGETVSA